MASKDIKPVLDVEKLTSTELMETFQKWDKDGNHYIEKEELNEFIKDLFYKKYKSRNFSKDKIEKFKEDIMRKYDRNNDKKLDITELATILPVQDNFLMQFSEKMAAQQNLTSVEFMKIWLHYDPHREGFLGRRELMGFVADYIQYYDHTKKSSDAAEKKVQWLLEKFDRDRDEEISMEEMQRFLHVEDNFLKDFKIKDGKKIKGIDKLWTHYDKDNNGEIGGAELDALVRDLVALKLTETKKSSKKSPDMKDISDWRDLMLEFSDGDADEVLNKKEIGDFLTKGLARATSVMLQ